MKALDAVPAERKQALTDALAELAAAFGHPPGAAGDSGQGYADDRAALLAGLAAFRANYELLPSTTNGAQHGDRQKFEPLAERLKGLVKQVDLLYKLATHAAQQAHDIGAVEEAAEFHDRRAASKRLKQLDEDRRAAVAQLKAAVHFHRQVVWLQERFPEAALCAVPGLCRVVSRADIEAADWSLTPGRYVGVAPPEVDEDFDFEQALKDIHVELADLNREAGELTARIQANFEELF